MKIKLKYAGFISEITGKNSEEIGINDDASLLSLLQTLASKYGQRFKAEVFNPESNERAPNVFILLNGLSIYSGFNRKFEDEDFVSIIPLVSGG